MSKKKKTIIIASIVLAALAIMGIVYALLSDKTEIINKITVGTVEIDSLKLRITEQYVDSDTISDEEEAEEVLMAPADIYTISWQTKNKGTSGVLTRHTLEIYYDDGVDFYMYPANMSEEAIYADFQKIQNGEESQYLIETEAITGEKNGMKYSFIGDALNGSDNKEVSNEVNYNTTVASIKDTNINTDDNDKKKDEISYRLLLSPKTSYLQQGKKISAKVTTEAMQYTEDGSENWQVVDVEYFNN